MNFRFWRRDLAIDLGTTNTLIYMPRRGIILQEPSVVALREGIVVAAGKKAQRMIGRTPQGVKVVKPLREGVVADYEMTRKMLAQFIFRVLKRYPVLRLRLIVTVPYGTTQVERRLDLYLSREINLPVRVAGDPFICAVRGASIALNYIDRLELQRG